MVISAMFGPASAHIHNLHASFRSLSIDSLGCADYPCANEVGDVGVYICRPDGNSRTLSTRCVDPLDFDNTISILEEDAVCGCCDGACPGQPCSKSREASSCDGDGHERYHMCRRSASASFADQLDSPANALATKDILAMSSPMLRVDALGLLPEGIENVCVPNNETMQRQLTGDQCGCCAMEADESLTLSAENCVATTPRSNARSATSAIWSRGRKTSDLVQSNSPTSDTISTTWAPTDDRLSLSKESKSEGSKTSAPIVSNSPTGDSLSTTPPPTDDSLSSSKGSKSKGSKTSAPTVSNSPTGDSLSTTPPPTDDSLSLSKGSKSKGSKTSAPTVSNSPTGDPLSTTPSPTNDSLSSSKGSKSKGGKTSAPTVSSSPTGDSLSTTPPPTDDSLSLSKGSKSKGSKTSAPTVSNSPTGDSLSTTLPPTDDSLSSLKGSKSKGSKTSAPTVSNIPTGDSLSTTPPPTDDSLSLSKGSKSKGSKTSAPTVSNSPTGDSLSTTPPPTDDSLSLSKSSKTSIPTVLNSPTGDSLITTPPPTDDSLSLSKGSKTLAPTVISGNLVQSPDFSLTFSGQAEFSNLNMANFTNDQNMKFIFKFESVVQNICSSNSDANIKDCSVIVQKLNGETVKDVISQSRHLISRNLPRAMFVDYEIIIEAICERSDCTDAQVVANTLYREVTGDLLAAINDGTLVSELQAPPDEIRPLLDEATTTGDFGPVVSPIVALISDWYPDWSGRSETCKNDGGAPMYMKRSGTFFENSLDKCCERYYKYTYSDCAGNAGTVPSGFYPNWGGSEQKCINAPARIPGNWLYDNIDSCCERYYSSELSDCIVASGGYIPPPADGSTEWFVDGFLHKCVKSCNDPADSQCGGFAKSWNEKFNTAAQCCSERLWYVEQSDCTL